MPPERTIYAVGRGGDMQGFTATWQDGVLRLSGELDLATDEDLLNAFRSVSDDVSEVILDLSELGFIDSTGIRAFETIAEEASPRGVVLRSPRRAVRKVINLTRLEDAAGVRVDDAPVVPEPSESVAGHAE
jgi:anti-anti-sigma factor